MKNLLLFSFLFCFTTISIAKTITGKVTNMKGEPLANVEVFNKNTKNKTLTNKKGMYEIEANLGNILVFKLAKFQQKEMSVTSSENLNVILFLKKETPPPPPPAPEMIEVVEDEMVMESVKSKFASNHTPGIRITQQPQNRESYKEIEENKFKMVNATPLSTFSIDVDKAGYSNVRRMINNGQKIPKDAVKIEEMINYFHYDYPQPTGKHPFSINTEVAQTPWNKESKLVKIGLQGKNVPLSNIPPSNLVFFDRCFRLYELSRQTSTA